MSRRRSSSTSWPSSSSAAVTPLPSCSAIGPSERSKRARRRSESMALNRPVEISQARGLAGTPSTGQRSTAAVKASCSASSASSKSPSSRIRVARTRRDSLRKRWSIESAVTQSRTVHHPDHKGDACQRQLACVTLRPLGAWLLCCCAGSLFSLGTLLGEVDQRTDLNGAGAGGGDLGRDLDGVVQVPGLDHVKTPELLLGFGERTVGGRHLAVTDPYRGGRLGRLQRLPRYVLPVLLDVSSKGEVLVHDRLAISGRDVGPVLFALVDQAQVFHDASR